MTSTRRESSWSLSSLLLEKLHTPATTDNAGFRGFHVTVFEPARDLVDHQQAHPPTHPPTHPPIHSDSSCYSFFLSSHAYQLSRYVEFHWHLCGAEECFAKGAIIDGCSVTEGIRHRGNVLFYVGLSKTWEGLGLYVWLFLVT